LRRIPAPKRGLVRLTLLSAGLLCGAVVIAASAVVLNGAASLLVGGAAAVVAGAAAGATDGGRAAAADAAWKAAAFTVTAIVLVSGLGVLAGGAVAAIAGLGFAVATAVVLLLRARPVRMAWSERHGPQALWPDRSPVPVSQLPTSALASEWRRTTVALADQLDPRTRQALVQRRREVLDELERRDPIGFSRWLAVGARPASDPTEFMPDDGANGTDAFGGQQ
jgi:hypothetical protein